jgi:hypothetical protein
VGSCFQSSSTTSRITRPRRSRPSSEVLPVFPVASRCTESRRQRVTPATGSPSLLTRTSSSTTRRMSSIPCTRVRPPPTSLVVTLLKLLPLLSSLSVENLLLLGEDRYLSTLMLKTFPKRKMMFIPQAVCKTVVPDTFKILLSQRRRWISTTPSLLVSYPNAVF